MADEETTGWEHQIDLALLNAGALLSSAPRPENLQEFCGLASTWMDLADSWTRRQSNELEYAKWSAGLGLEIELEVDEV